MVTLHHMERCVSGTPKLCIVLGFSVCAIVVWAMSPEFKGMKIMAARLVASSY